MSHPSQLQFFLTPWVWRWDEMVASEALRNCWIFTKLRAMAIGDLFVGDCFIRGPRTSQLLVIFCREKKTCLDNCSSYFFLFFSGGGKTYRFEHLVFIFLGGGYTFGGYISWLQSPQIIQYHNVPWLAASRNELHSQPQLILARGFLHSTHQR